jgi:hypothetical protein
MSPPRLAFLVVPALLLPIVLAPKVAGAANTRVCISVQQKSWNKPASNAPPADTKAVTEAKPAQEAASGPPAEAAPGPVPAAPPPNAVVDGERKGPWPYAPPTPPARAVRQNAAAQLDPTLYLARMLAYEVTHEPGFVAVDDRCEQRIAVELYQLESGWTVFARYSGTEREEKVVRAELDEFDELAQRIAFALLRKRPITHTITRENVLRSDSETNLRTIDGTGHLTFGMGTEVRLARLSTAQGAAEPVATETRLLTPVSIQLGYRRKLRAWGLDAFGRINLGTENTGIHANDRGGHVDYGWSGLLGLHFLRYLDATGVNSLYFGGGAAFELASFNVVRPASSRGANAHDSLIGGGLNLDVLIGYEFLRASTIHFYGQLELNAPTYIIKAENDAGGVSTYLPGALAQIGVVF